MTLRSKMILGGIAAVVIPFLIAGIVTYVLLSRSLETLYKEKTVQIAVDLANLLQASLLKECNLVLTLSKDTQVIEAASLKNYLITEKKLQELYKLLHADHDSFFQTDENGIVRADAVSRQRIGVDISNRDYFIQAKKGQVTVGEPVISRASGDLIVVVCAPVFSADGDFSGVIATSLNIDSLRGKIASVKIGDTGYAAVIKADGQVLIHPKKEYILNVNAFREIDTGQMAENMRQTRKGSGRYTFRGIEKIASFAPIDLTGWTVTVTQDRNEIMAPANVILNFIMLGGAVFILIIIGGIVLWSEKISSPVQKTMDVLQQVTEHSAEIVVNIGQDKRIEAVNPAMEKLMKCPAKEITGTKPVLKNANNMPEEEIWGILDEGKVWTGRVVAAEKASDPVTMDVMIIPICNERGAVSGYLEIGRDISRELMIDNRLRQAEKMESIGTLAGGIAHDFNNILSGILGYTELSLAALGDPKKLRKYLDEVLSSGQRARDLVHQILTFSRQTPFELQEINPKYIVNEALKLLRASIPSTVEWQVNLISSAIILADPTQFHQILVNLCTNAAHAMKDGKGAIEVVLEDMEVDEDFSRLHPGLHPGRHIRLRVSDTGCGIPPESLEHIFDPFFTTKPAGEGTGLGLSVVHGIVQKFKGIVTVYSEAGKGTTFNIIIPATAADQKEEVVTAGEVMPGGHERIILVDDEEQIVRITEATLTKLGYQVSPFMDSQAALDAYLNHPGDYDLLITDYTMPNLIGTEIAGIIREAGHGVPILLCSGYIHKAMEESSMHVGIREILRKPVSRKELATAVRRCLDNNPDADRLSA